jgi:hypothetical protein
MDSWGQVDAAVRMERSAVHGGEAAVSIFAINATDDALTRFMQCIGPGDFAGHRVRFRAYVRSHKVDHWAGLWMRADSRTQGAIAFDNMSSRKIVGTTDWQEYSVVLNIADRTAGIFFGALIEGTGQIWLDDCTLEIVSQDVDSTAKFLIPIDRPFRAPPQMRRRPVNLDFEGSVSSR